MADNRGFTRSPSGIAWAHNNRPDVVCLAGPQVAAASLPSGWVETIELGCGPDRSRNGGEASASVILLKADGGEVVSHPSGWTDGNRMPRGWPLDPDTSVRMGYGQPKTALIFMSKSRMSRHRVSRSLPQTIGRRRRSVAYAGAKVTGSFLNQREKDEIRQQRLVQYLTWAARVAKPR